MQNYLRNYAERPLDKPNMHGYNEAMPTVFVCQGICVLVYLKEHPPPHVHAKTPSGEVVIYLGKDGVSRYVPASDMSKSDVRKAVKAVENRLAECWTTWKRYHR